MFALEWFRLEVFMEFAGVIVVITQLIKLAPPAFTSSYPKIIAWIVTAIVVGGIGIYQGADTATILTIGTAIGFAANGLYDVVSSLIASLKK